MVNRINTVVVDELGMDPLRDPYYEAVMSVTTFTYETVTAAYEHKAANLSDLWYGTTALWPAILYYNKLCDNWDLVTGLQIKRPDYNELSSALNRVTQKAQQRTQRI